MTDPSGGPAGILGALREEFNAAACSVALVEGTELVFVAAVGVGAEQLIGRRIPLGRGIAGWTVVSGQPIAVADVEQHAQFDRATAESTGYVPRSILAVPLDGEDASIGVLEVLDREPGADDFERASAAAATLTAQFLRRTDEQAPESGRIPTAVSDRDLDDLVDQLREAAPETRAAAVAMISDLLAAERAAAAEQPPR